MTTKAEAVARRTERRRQARKERDKELACFWTWPWGHVWRYDGRASFAHFYKCEACGKVKVEMP